MPEKQEAYNPLLKSYPDSEKVNAVSVGAETLFTRLIAQCDDKAHYFGEAGMILGKLYTTRMCAGQVDQKQVESWLSEIENVGLTRSYEVAGRRYLEVVHCKKSHRKDVKQDIRFPLPEAPDGATEGIHQESPDGDTEPCFQAKNGDLPPKPPSERIRNEFESSNQTKPNQTNTSPVPGVGVDPPESEDGESEPSAGLRTRNGETIPPGFARWWAAWPSHHRKQGKTKCLREWKRQKLEPITGSVLQALALATRSSDWTKNGGAFIPFPQTWLNRTPWESLGELEGARPTQSNGPVTVRF